MNIPTKKPDNYEPGTEGLTDPNHHLNAALEAVAAVARTLKQERDEAREDATSLAERLTVLELTSTSELARLERERDEAREQVEIIKPAQNSPVAEFFSSSNTPETDAAEFYYDGKTGFVEIAFCRNLERDRDEARAVIRMLWQRAETYLDLSEEEIDRVNRSWGKSTK